MKKMRNYFGIILVICMICFPALLMAQPTDPPDGDQVYDVAVPFDGGVSLLVAAGIGYGVKKARDKRKANKM